jgi:hypothetical protein
MLSSGNMSRLHHMVGSIGVKKPQVSSDNTRFFVLNPVEHYWLSSFASVLGYFVSVRSHRAILSGRVGITVGNLSFSADQKLHPSDNPRNYGSNQGYIQRYDQKPDGGLCV